MFSGDVPCRLLQNHQSSAGFFKVTRRTKEDINTASAILVDIPSTATLAEESLEVINNLLPIENKKQK